MAKAPVIGFSRRKDFEDTAKAVEKSNRQDMRGQKAGRDTPAPPHLRWGKVVTAWADGDLNTVTVRPCYADGTAIPGIKTTGIHDKKLYIAWPPETDPGNMVALLPKDALLPWVPFQVAVNTDFFGVLLIGVPAGGPVEPPAFDTIGVNTEGTEAAYTDTWDVTTNANGLAQYEMVRVGFFHAGDEKLYGYIRKKEYSADGRLLRVSAETRIEIDVPGLC